MRSGHARESSRHDLLHQQIRIANPDIEGWTTAKSGILFVFGFVEMFVIWNHSVVDAVELTLLF